MDRLMKELLKEAHDHGYTHSIESLGWDATKSWVEFLKQNNIPLLTEDEIRDQNAIKAIQMQSQGHSLRNIASVLGYSHPQSIKNLIFWYNKRLKKQSKHQKEG